LVSYVSLDDPNATEALVENCLADEQTRAIMATPTLLGEHIHDIQQYVQYQQNQHPNEANPDFELAVTEFGHAVGPTGDPAQQRNLRGVVATADLIQEMLARDVDFGCFWNLNNWFYHIAQPVRSVAYDPIEHPDASEGNVLSYIMSPAAQLYRLLLQHTGAELLTVTGLTTDTFTTPDLPYADVPANKTVPYLSALATAADWNSTDNYYRKIYVMVINKDWVNDREDTTITLNNLGAAPTGVTWHTLKSWDTATSDPLEAQNDLSYPDRVSIQTVSDGPPGSSSITHTFPSGSVTVMELTVGKPAPVYNTADLFHMPDSSSVSLDGKIVTAVFPDRFYIEEPSRTAGVAVEWTSTMPTVNQKVTLAGTMGTENGERVITASSQPSYDDGDAVDPLGMRSEWLGGESPGSPAATLQNGFGFYNVGLLVATWGNVTYVDTGQTPYFYIDDGAWASDGSGHAGLRVAAVPPTGLAAGDFVVVTGILAATHVSTADVRVLRPRGEGDIAVIADEDPGWNTSVVDVPVAGINVITLTGIPRDSSPTVIFSGWDLEGNLWRRDPVLQQIITYSTGQHLGPWGNCYPAEGYFLRSPTSSSTYQHTRWPSPTDQLISLPRGSEAGPGYYSLIGNPFTDVVPWSSCTLTDGAVSHPLTSLEPWLHQIDRWDAVSGTWDLLADLSGDMEASTAYRIYPKVDNLALIVPKPLYD
jgi:hypothetical protein